MGKSTLAQELGRKFESMAVLDLELRRDLVPLFESSLEPVSLVAKLEAALDVRIVPGETLLFIDEIQEAPRALTSLRYFHEKMPELHVMAAGSLMDFVIEQVGMPVGRVTSRYIYPMSFHEFLTACGHDRLVEHLDDHPVDDALEPVLHDRLVGLLGEYMAVGGMPEAVNTWIETRSLELVRGVHTDLLVTYRQDFSKYARRGQVNYLEKVFSSVPRLLARKYVFSQVDASMRARDLRPALEALTAAGVVTPVWHTKASAVPLDADVDPRFFKTIFLDVALAQTLLGTRTGNWLVHPGQMLSSSGPVVEAFVGQELLAYSDPLTQGRLYYWARDKPGAKAEVDYVIASGTDVVPVEVKGGKPGRLKSLRYFLANKRNSSHGLQISTRPFSTIDDCHSIPLYAVFRTMGG